MNNFMSLGINTSLIQALEILGINEPTEVQKQAVPLLLEKKDLSMQSETGTGKTLAYLLPIYNTILSNIDEADRRWPVAVIICPTQELAVQVANHSAQLAMALQSKNNGAMSQSDSCQQQGLSKLRNRAPKIDSGLLNSPQVRSLVLLGGTQFTRQKQALKIHPHIIVGTPGRLADLTRLRYFDLSHLQFLILDEADRLFSREYIEPVEFLLSNAPKNCTHVMASATIPERTRNRAKPWIPKPIVIELEREGVLSQAIEHWAFYSDHRKKIDLLKRIIAAIHPKRCLIFASEAYRVQRAAERLNSSGLQCASLVSRMEKQSRHSIIEQFKTGGISLLITTDLAARGLDIPDITHVISLDLPEDGGVYVHRAGRTARAGKKGISILIADKLELERASRTATRFGFVFRTKWLEYGTVMEPPVEAFFERVEDMETQKRSKSHL